jgi:hypothetical protein
MDPETFRPPFWLRIASNAPLIAAAALFLLSGAIAFGLVVAGLMVAFVVRSMMLRITVADDGVTVVNWRGTERYPWSDVLYFEFDRAGLWLVRRSRERVAVKAFAFGRALKAARRQGEAVVERLEAVRKAHKAPPQPRQRKKKR